MMIIGYGPIDNDKLFALQIFTSNHHIYMQSTCIHVVVGAQVIDLKCILPATKV